LENIFIVALKIVVWIRIIHQKIPFNHINKKFDPGCSLAF